MFSKHKTEEKDYRTKEKEKNMRDRRYALEEGKKVRRKKVKVMTKRRITLDA